MSATWEEPAFRRVTGNTWRPGGLELTRRALDWCAARNLLRPGGLALDMGCGAGGTLNLLTSLGLRAVGLDRRANPDAEAAQGAAWRMCADVTRPPLAAGIADILLFECVLSLLAEPRTALCAASRVLARGGICIVSDITLRIATASEQRDASSCFSGALSPRDWRALLQTAGLRVLHEEDHSHALAQLAARLVWYDEDTADRTETCLARVCGFPSSGKSCQPRGYGLWIARKEAICTP